MSAIFEHLLIVFVIVFVAIVATAIIVRERDRRKVEYMLDAFEDGEYNFRFDDKSRFNRTLNRIKWIVDRRRSQNETESWTKLIRVLTHEIMNTVGPIASLSDTLSRYTTDEMPKHQDDIAAGLETIGSSSRGLIDFVQNYRELTGVARPIKKPLMVRDLIADVIDLTRERCREAGTQCSFSELSSDTLIYADHAQLSRVLINLVNNAIEAGASQITITAELTADSRTVIRVRNNGAPIPAGSQQQIFIPFYTTKQQGNGIGLSLSRQILQAHNGSIELASSNPTATEFVIIFR
ncbi:MAG: HAMP domain-containing histidine kinase [Bacteroidales bacterium]|nr:HAMP domain-containing histidine kinase [Bacteroidales bacterium]